MAIISPYRNKRVLIIDDVPAMRSSIRSQLTGLGVEQTSVAGTVRDADTCRESAYTAAQQAPERRATSSR